MKVDLVFQGGGARGIAYVRRLVGTSAGAISVALLAAGYTYEEMEIALNETRDGVPVFQGFMSAPLLDEFGNASLNKSLIIATLTAIKENTVGSWFSISSLLPASDGWVDSAIGFITGMGAAELTIQGLISAVGENRRDVVLSIINLIERGGWFSARKFMEWMDERLEEKGLPTDITFRQLFDKNGHDLSLIGADLSGQKMLVLNHKTSPDLPVGWAVRMSMNIPFVWDPVIWQDSFGTYLGEDLTGHRIVDGGALSNFAIRLTTSDDPDVLAVMDEQFSPDEAFTIGFMLDGQADVAGAPPVPVVPEDEEPSDPQAWYSSIWHWVRSVVVDVLQARPNTTNVVTTFYELLTTMMVASDNFTIAVTGDHICKLPAKGFGTLEFAMTPERREALVSAAEATTLDFLKNVPDFQLVDFTLEAGADGMFEIALNINGTLDNKDWIGLFPSPDAPQGSYTEGNWSYVRELKEGRFITQSKAEIGPFVARYYRRTWTGYELVRETAPFNTAVVK